MKVGSLFSGIGGLDLGFERAGMEVAWQCEKDPFCRRVLAKHWPNIPCYEDVKALPSDELEPVDVICGGFPCQPVSVAGRQKGTNDERWLWPEFNRLLRLLRPRYAIVENVPGLFTVQRGQVFGEILRDLAEGGYDAEWDCLSAAQFGAPHRRYRVFIIATNCEMDDPKCDGLAPFPQPRSPEENVRSESTGAHESFDVAGASRLPSPGRDVADVTGLNGRFFVGSTEGEWLPEPRICRVAPRFPARVDSVRVLGNAVVPQVAEWIGRQVMRQDT